MATAARSKSVLTGAAAPANTVVALMARVRGQGGSLITPGQISSIAYTVTDLTEGEELGDGTFVVADTVFADLMQGDPRWSQDSAANPGPDGTHGYNFCAFLPASLFPASTITARASSPYSSPPAARKKVRCDVAFTPASGGEFRVCFEWEVVPVYG